MEKSELFIKYIVAFNCIALVLITGSCPPVQLLFHDVPQAGQKPGN